MTKKNKTCINDDVTLTQSADVLKVMNKHQIALNSPPWLFTADGKIWR